MATKQEIAEGLTIAQLRELADQEGVDLAGLSTKDEIADAVASGVGKDTLSSYAEGENGAQSEDTATTTRTSSAPSTASTNREPIGEDAVADIPLTAEAAAGELPALGPPNPEPVATSDKAPRNEVGSIAHDPVAQQKAGVSPADLEVPGLGAGGPTIIVKQNPETPSPHQVAGALAAVPGPVVPTVTVQDHEGEEVPHKLGTDDLALINSRAVASNSGHPAHTTPGHWSNPLLTPPTEDEIEADQKAYAERFGS